ncbi:MAG: putative dehydrogenase [Octadecabacter sp.]|jgi:predicted dehydrogenase
MEMVNYGIIGCGMMAREHIANINLLPHGRVTVVYDPMRELAEDCAVLAGKKDVALQVVVADTLDELLACQNLDAVVIVSPNHHHVGQLREIVTKRPLPILCEKPLFTDSADRYALDELFNGYSHPVWVAMEYRYMPPVAALIEQSVQATGGISMLSIREHRFPFLSKIGDWNRFNVNTGGTLVEKCCHFFDLMRLILKAEPIRVMASADQKINHKDETYNGKTPDIWDNGYVILDFDSGARAMLELCMFAEGSRYQEEISAVGPKGKIECLVPGPGRFWPAKLGPAPVSQLIISPRAPQGPIAMNIPVDPTLLNAGDHNGSTFYQHERFNAVVRGYGIVEVTLSDGAKAVAMGLAAQKSARTGQAVML